MTPPLPHTAEATLGGCEPVLPRTHTIPHYLEQAYWWAYVHPRAVHIFEREWLVNSILFGNYSHLRDTALAELGSTVTGHTLQVACVYGNLTMKLRERLAPDAKLDVVDILPIQLKNLAAKMPADERVAMIQSDSSALPMADASVDKVLLFFLLHEQPEAVRRGTLAEAMRVCKPGGRVVIVDYHKPKLWHPMRLLMRLVFSRLEPFAMDLWRNELSAFFPEGIRLAAKKKSTFFGGLYQMLVIER
ncbi:MAG: rhodoquinone biosynthesis methyltransferase RquA [Vitreoscilla sp.]|nr:methyltransferase domain-containing protein [Burkholderiales bacterium]MBP6336375.1 rhodoquinone biosynthesis methyltransferase RquA [Vitreoscilla sp.]